MWHVAPWRHAGAQPHAAREPGEQLAEECEAFLQGRLPAQLSLNRQPVPSWAWLNQVAHSGHAELARIASEARHHRQLGRRHAAWRWAITELAADLLHLTDALPEEISRLQKEALVPLELEMARTLQPALPKAVLKEARAALYRAHHLRGSREGTPDSSMHWPLRKTKMGGEAPSGRQGSARVVTFVMYTLVLAGVATGLALASGSASSTGTLYAYYMSRVSGLANPFLQNREAFRWMTGGASAPGWEQGRDLPTFALPWTAHDPGGHVGALFAGAPGMLVAKSKASRAAAQASVAAVDRALNTAVFRSDSVHLVMAALPDDRFEAAGLVDPVIVVKAGAKVSITFFNEDDASAHGLAITRAGLSSSWEPMAVAEPAFKGAAVWFLGNMIAGRVHEAALNFIASMPGHYQYLDPVPGQAQAGMAGNFLVEAAYSRRNAGKTPLVGRSPAVHAPSRTSAASFRKAKS